MLSVYAFNVGPGESGKSTIFKQMKLLTLGGGFEDEELASFKHIIYSNCVSQMKVLLQALVKLEMSLELPENEVRITEILHKLFISRLRIEQSELEILLQQERHGLQKLQMIYDIYGMTADCKKFMTKKIRSFNLTTLLPSK